MHGAHHKLEEITTQLFIKFRYRVKSYNCDMLFLLFLFGYSRRVKTFVNILDS